jgi:DNA adenine methylase
VPHRSPFRYPGGKTWLVPRIRQWLTALPARPARLLEPIAGGAIIGLTAAFEQLANHVTLVELDPAVGAVWETILNDSTGGEWLAAQIEHFDLTLASVQDVLARTKLTKREIAFQTMIRNRVQRGGIMAAGAGLIKSGENGKGLLSRWYPQTLKQRILDIVAIKDRITFIPGDGLTMIESVQALDDVVLFIDPPYTATRKGAGSRLYAYNVIDHKALFQLISTVRGEFLITYDDSPEIRDLCQVHHFEFLAVPMQNTHHARKQELLIGRTLDWAR